METYYFVGIIFSDSIRITTKEVIVDTPKTLSLPKSAIYLRVMDNHILAKVETKEKIKNKKRFLELSEWVKSIASSACITQAVCTGAWISVAINSCFSKDEDEVISFNNLSKPLANAFKKNHLIAEDVISIYQHKEGFFLRLALEDVNAGLSNQLFMHSHFYRAIESLRNSVAPQQNFPNRKECWEVFRKELKIPGSFVILNVSQAERHGDYKNFLGFTDAYKSKLFKEMAYIITKYVEWFNQVKFPRNKARN